MKKEDIQEYFKREVLPFAPDAWISEKEANVWYEINFNKYFYEYIPPRSLEDIAKDIFALEEETDWVLRNIINKVKRFFDQVSALEDLFRYYVQLVRVKHLWSQELLSIRR